QEDRHRRARGDPRAEDHHQHDGRPAVLLRRGGHPRGPRGGHRGPARRPGARAGRGRHLARPDRVGERDGREPDPAGARHRARGDLNLKIDVDASGEIQELQDYINKMIANLRDTTIANKEQDWLKGNLARISALMQGRRDLEDVASLIMSELTPVVSAQHGAFFLAMPLVDGEDLHSADDDQFELRMLGSYGYSMGSMPTSFRPGEGLIGTAATEKR